MDLIDREDAINAIYHHIPYMSKKRATIILHEVQGMELIRCKDCKHYDKGTIFPCGIAADFIVGDDDYCSSAERREE